MCYEYCVAECKLYFCSFLSSSPAPSTWTWTTRERGCRASSLQEGPVSPQTMAVKLFHISNCFPFNRLLLLGASHFPPPVVRSLLAIVQRGGKEKNRDLLWRTSLALLCELSTLNPDLFLEAGGPLVNLKCTVLLNMITLFCQPRWCQSCHLLPTGLFPNASSH